MASLVTRGETFGLKWCDLTVIYPWDAAVAALPTNVGAILLRLLEQTKSSQSSVADVVISFCTGSGLSLGKWILRLRACCTPDGRVDTTSLWVTDERFLFEHASGAPWDSAFYRSTFLIPFLQMQRIEGDAYLQPYDGSPGWTLLEAFYSMHVHRAGGRSHVSQKRPGCFRKATNEEVNEHGRWRLKRSGESMAEQYRQWGLPERVAITLLCM